MELSKEERRSIQAEKAKALWADPEWRERTLTGGWGGVGVWVWGGEFCRGVADGEGGLWGDLGRAVCLCAHAWPR
jgi:hypothetical protein